MYSESICEIYKVRGMGETISKEIKRGRKMLRGNDNGKKG
jgi:hypothetical protein